MSACHTRAKHFKSGFYNIFVQSGFYWTLIRPVASASLKLRPYGAIEIPLLFFLLLLSDSSITLVLLAKYRDEMERGDPHWGGEVDY